MNNIADDIASAYDEGFNDGVKSLFEKLNEDSKTNIDFDMFDFSKLSIDEKFWALVFFIFANCKDIEFIEKIKDKFNIDDEKIDKSC